MTMLRDDDDLSPLFTAPRSISSPNGTSPPSPSSPRTVARRETTRRKSLDGSNHAMAAIELVNKMMSKQIVASNERITQPKVKSQIPSEELKLPREIMEKAPRLRTDEELNMVGHFFLTHISFFGKLGEAESKELCAHMKVLKLQPGDILMRQGDLGDKFYIVLYGEVDVAMVNQEQSPVAHRRRVDSSDSDSDSMPGVSMGSDVPNDVERMWQGAKAAIVQATNSLTQISEILNGNHRGPVQTAIANSLDWVALCQNYVDRKVGVMRSHLIKAAVEVDKSVSNLQSVEFKRIAPDERRDWSTVTGNLRKVMNVAFELLPALHVQAIAALGKVVGTIGAGGNFGELALINDDNKRNASIFAGSCTNFTELAVIDRAMYNASLKTMHTQLTKEKLKFLTELPYFDGWSSSKLDKLAWNMNERKIHFNGHLTNVGDVASHMYFIVSGEFKVLQPAERDDHTAGTHHAVAAMQMSRGSRMSLRVHRPSTIHRGSILQLRRGSVTAAAKPLNSELSDILSGHAHTAFHGHRANMLNVGLIGRGDIAGEVVLRDKSHYEYTVVATHDDSTVLEVNRKDVERWIKPNAGCLSALLEVTEQRKKWHDSRVQQVEAKRRMSLAPPPENIFNTKATSGKTGATHNGKYRNGGTARSSGNQPLTKALSADTAAFGRDSTESERYEPDRGNASVWGSNSRVERAPNHAAERARRGILRNRVGALVQDSNEAYANVKREHHTKFTADLRLLQAENDKLMRSYGIGMHRRPFESKHVQNVVAIANGVSLAAFTARSVESYQKDRAVFRGKWLPSDQRLAHLKKERDERAMAGTDDFETRRAEKSRRALPQLRIEHADSRTAHVTFSRSNFSSFMAGQQL